MALIPQGLTVTFDKYGFILLALIVVVIFDTVCLVFGIPPTDIVAIDGILVTIIGYGVLKEAMQTPTA